MSTKIIDEFTREPMSPQLRAYYRAKRDGACVSCGRRAGGGVRCASCRKLIRARRAANATNSTNGNRGNHV